MVNKKKQEDTRRRRFPAWAIALIVAGVLIFSAQTIVEAANPHRSYLANGSSYESVWDNGTQNYIAIGTDQQPTHRLEVNGTLWINGTDGGSYVNGSPVCTAANGLCAAGSGTVTSVGLTTNASGVFIWSNPANPIVGAGTFTIDIQDATVFNRGLLNAVDFTTFTNKLGLAGNGLNQSGVTVGVFAPTTGANQALGWNSTNWTIVSVGTGSGGGNITGIGAAGNLSYWTNITNLGALNPVTASSNQYSYWNGTGFNVRPDQGTTYTGSNGAAVYGTNIIVNATGCNGNEVSTFNTTTFNCVNTTGTSSSIGNASAGQVTFYNGTNSVTGSSTLFWNNTSQSLGVNTSNPTANLFVLGNATVFLGKNQVIQLNDGASDNAVWASTNIGLITQSSKANIVSGGAIPITFNTGGSRNTLSIGTERMRVDQNGGVSINNTGGNFTFQVVGNANITQIFQNQYQVVDYSRNVFSGNGLQGGGTLAADRNISVNAPNTTASQALGWNGSNWTVSSFVLQSVLDLLYVNVSDLQTFRNNIYVNVTNLQSSNTSIYQSLASINTTAVAAADPGNCVGSNATHINVTQNTTTGGVQCVAVALNPGSGSSYTSSNGITLYGTNFVANATICGGGQVSTFNGTTWNCVNTTNTGSLSDLLSDVNNSGTAETVLYSYTIPAGTLTVNGDKLVGLTSGTFVASGTATRDIRINLNGTKIFDSSALTSAIAAGWTVSYLVSRDSATTARTTVSIISGISSGTNYTSVSTVNWSNSNIFNITGQAGGVGAATGDITATVGYITKGEFGNSTLSGYGNVSSNNGTTNYIARFTNNTNIGTGTLQDNGSFVNASNNDLGGLRVPAFYNIYNNSNVSGNFTVNWNNGAIQNMTLNGTVNNMSFIAPTAGTSRLTLFIKQDTVGSRTIGWNGSLQIFWQGAAAPTLTTTASRTDIITCLYAGVNSTGGYWCTSSLNFG